MSPEQSHREREALAWAIAHDTVPSPVETLDEESDARLWLYLNLVYGVAFRALAAGAPEEGAREAAAQEYSDALERHEP